MDIVGAQGTPQAKIIGARISFGTSDINYHHSTVPSTSQSISITATATFVKKDSILLITHRPLPLLPYQFRMMSGIRLR